MNKKKAKKGFNWYSLVWGSLGAGVLYLTIDTISRIKAMKKLQYRLADFRLEKQGAFTKLVFITEITNPTHFNYKVRKADLVFSYQNLRLGRFVKDKLSVPANSRQLVELPIYIKDGDLKGLIAAIIANRTTIINIVGSLRYKGIGIPISYDLDVTDYLPLLSK